MKKLRHIEGGRGWVVFQKNVCLGSGLVQLEGGSAESHREYYVGEGLSGELRRAATRGKLTTQEGCDRTSCSVPTGADGVTAVGLLCTAVIDVTFI